MEISNDSRDNASAKSLPMVPNRIESETAPTDLHLPTLPQPGATDTLAEDTFLKASVVINGHVHLGNGYGERPDLSKYVIAVGKDGKIKEAWQVDGIHGGKFCDIPLSIDLKLFPDLSEQGKQIFLDSQTRIDDALEQLVQLGKEQHPSVELQTETQSKFSLTGLFWKLVGTHN